MGGSGGSTTIGFGGGSATALSLSSSSAGPAGAFGSSAPQSGQLSMLSSSTAGVGPQLVLPKRAKVETLAERTSNGNAASNAAPTAAPAKPALPAFLQPQNLAAVYKQANGDAQ